MRDKYKNARRFGVATALTFGALAVGLVPASMAQATGLICTWTGDGADANFSTVANWTSCEGGAPGDADTVLFPAGATVTTVNNDLTDVAFTSVNVGDGYTVGGSEFAVESNLTLGENVTLDTPVTFGTGAASNNVFAVGSGSTLSQPMTLNTSAFAVNVAAGNSVALPALSGSTETVTTTGAGTISTPSSTFTTGTGGVVVQSGVWECLAADCFGAAANGVGVIGDATVVLNTDDEVPNDIAMTSSAAGDPTLSSADGTTPEHSGRLVTVGSPKLEVGSASVWTSLGQWELGSSTLQVTGADATSRHNLYGVINGSAQAALSLSGGVYEMDGSNPNTYGGTTTVANSGTLNLLKDGAVPGNLVVNDSLVISDDTVGATPALTDTIGDSSVVTVEGASSVVTLQNDETIGALSGSGGSVLADPDVSAAGGFDLTLNVTGNYVFAGNLTAVTLTKAGSGQQTISNDFAVSQLSVNNGTLVLNGNAVVSSTLDVQANGVLKGDGTLLVDTLSVNGVLAPGNSPGTITVTGDLDLAGGTYLVELSGPTAGSEYDQTVVSGTATLGGELDVDLLSGHSPTAGTVYTVLRAGTVSGTFAGLSDGDTVSVNGQNFRINYNLSATGEDTVTLTALAVTSGAGADEGTLAETGDNLLMIALLAGSLIAGSGAFILRSLIRRSLHQ